MRLVLSHTSRVALAVVMLLLVVGCGSSMHADRAASVGGECHSPDDCETALTSLFGRRVLLPHATTLELSSGRLAERPGYVPLGNINYIDHAVNVRFQCSVAKEGHESEPLSIGCKTTAAQRLITSPSGRRACYEHSFGKLSTHFFHDGMVYTAIVSDPAAPRGTTTTATTRWLARLLDSYS